VFTSQPKYVNQLRSFVEKGLTYKGATFLSTTFEAGIAHSLRFMIDNELVGMSWIRLEKGHYAIRPTKLKTTRCQLEIDVEDYTKLKGLPYAEGEYG